MIRIVLAAAALAMLTGCAELGARAVTSGLEAVDAAKDLVDEKTDRREALRKRLYALEDRLLDCYSSMASAGSAELDCQAVREAVDQASAYIDEVYPDLTRLADEIGKFREAVSRLRQE